MSSNKPLQLEANFSQIPNYLFDVVMPMVSPSEWVVLCFVARKTYESHKDKNQISFSQIAKGTGISQRTVVTATNSLVSQGFLSRELSQKSNNGDDASWYTINLGDFK